MHWLRITKVKYFKFIERLVSSITYCHIVQNKYRLKTKKAHVGGARYYRKKNLNIARSVNFKELQLRKISNEEQRGTLSEENISFKVNTYIIKIL
jgi:hypothetical protein